MIIAPLNDHECLHLLSQRAAAAVVRPDVVQLASRVRDTREVARYLRTLPQRDDDAATAQRDDPTVQCDVPQRARILATDPNCVERAITYIAVAENVDPKPWRQLWTVDTPLGRHTLPVEDGLPVILDPAMPRDAITSGLMAFRNARGLSMDAAQTLRFITRLADEAAATPVLRRRVERARHAFERLLDGWGIPPETIDDVATTLVLASRTASEMGAETRRNVCACAHALDALQRNQRNAKGRHYKIRINWPLVKKLGVTYGPTAVAAVATAYGVPAPVAFAAAAATTRALTEEEQSDATQASTQVITSEEASEEAAA